MVSTPQLKWSDCQINKKKEIEKEREKEKEKGKKKRNKRKKKRKRKERIKLYCWVLTRNTFFLSKEINILWINTC